MSFVIPQSVIAQDNLASNLTIIPFEVSRNGQTEFKRHQENIKTRAVMDRLDTILMLDWRILPKY